MSRLSRVLTAMAVPGVQQEGWRAAGSSKGPGIPRPSGQYRVGCVDLMHQLEGDDKGLLVRLHYPTQATPQAGYAYSHWYPHRKYIEGYLDFINENLKHTDDLAKFTVPQIPALESAPLLHPVGGTALPVIVFSHGLGGMRTCYSAITCDLASHGYMVACVEHRDGSACMSLQRVPISDKKGEEFKDCWIKYRHLAEGEKEFPLRNRQVSQRADEVKKCLDILTLLNEGAAIKDMLGVGYNWLQFKGSMNLSTAALMGHSFGGGTTVLALSQDTRFKCGLALDCWMYPLHRDFYSETDISQPLYFINSHDFQWTLNIQRMMSLAKSPDSNGSTPCRVLTIKGTHHFNQCDMPFVSPRTLSRLGLKESSLDSELAHRVNMDICHAFLKRHLLNDPAYQWNVPDLDGTDGHSEHIIFGTNLNPQKSNL